MEDTTAHIIDLISTSRKEGPFISYEFFPPKTPAGLTTLSTRLDNLSNTDPLFVDFTWGAGGSTSDLTLQLSTLALKKGLVPNMHLTCTNMDTSLITSALNACVQSGICNIVALRGDPPLGQETWIAEEEGKFTCALDLVTFIKQEYGTFFGVSVAGYPEGHPSTITPILELSTLTETELGRVVTNDKGELFVCSDLDFEKEIKYLKQKVDAGADFIITQLFFDTRVYFEFVQACRKIGIMCPIVPGIMCITNVASFEKMTGFCKTRVPESLRNRLMAVKEDLEMAKRLGIQIGIEMCTALVKTCHDLPGLHFYTLNQEGTVRAIVEGISPLLTSMSLLEEESVLSP